MPELVIEDLVVEYRTGDYPVRPIDHLDVTVEPGSLVLLLGPSGCGKTTLLSALGGILTVTSGRIRFGEVEVTSLSGPALTAYRREQVGFVFQAFNLVPSLTALDNVMVPLRTAKVARAQRRERADELLDLVGLADRAHHKPGDLSGGQQQRVAIARALALDPSLVLADEPTAHLDFVQVEEVLKLIRTLASSGRTVVVSTHDERMVPLADQVIEMVPKFRNDLREPERVNLDAGAALFRQGEPSELVYLVESGEVDIVRELVDGGEELLATIGPGNYFGEIGPMLGLARSATARARSDSVLLGFTVRSFRERVGADGVRGLVETDPV
jgi:putative ABC transport system ATP-binding protein